MDRIDPKYVRYIKLGSAGRWARKAFELGEIPFGYASVPHEICVEGDWDSVAEQLIREGRSPAKAKDAAREIRDFYTLGDDCLWITMAHGHLWWAFAEPEVTWIGDDDDRGNRVRKARTGWRKDDINGYPLLLDRLSTRLTQVAAYRQTICSVKESDYLIRRINAVEEPVVERARAARDAMIDVAAEMISALHWSDFETLVDLIFSRGGWQRVSRVGENLTDIDLILEQPTTGERAFVQVKSKASQPILDDYVGRLRLISPEAHVFFVCHSPKGRLSSDNDTRLSVWTGDRIASAAVSVGLFDWLLMRTS